MMTHTDHISLRTKFRRKLPISCSTLEKMSHRCLNWISSSQASRTTSQGNPYQLPKVMPSFLTYMATRENIPSNIARVA